MSSRIVTSWQRRDASEGGAAARIAGALGHAPAILSRLN